MRRLRYAARVFRPLLIALCLSVVSVSVVACSHSATPARSAESAPASTSSVRLRLVSPPWPPFTDGPDKPRVALSIVESALSRAGFAVSFEILPPVRWAEELRGGTSDGSAATWHSTERDAYLLYSKPYLQNRLVLVGRTGSDVSAKAFAELKGKRIGIIEGFAYGEAVDSAREPVFVKGADTEASLRALLKSEIDYVLVDALVVQYLFEQEPEQAKAHFVVGSNTLVQRDLHLTVRKARPDAQRVIAAFDAEITKMLRDGSYNRLLEVGWLEADIDGDGASELVFAGAHAGAVPPQTAYKPLPTITHPSGPAPSAGHFVIEGIVYDSWDQVPAQYKVPADRDLPPPKTVRFNVFKF